MQPIPPCSIHVPRFLLALTVLLLGGCVQTAMLPANEVEEGETYASVSVGEPGALFIPRLNVQITQGVGGGDVTAILSTTPTPEQPIFGGGVAARSYLKDDLALEGQLQATLFPTSSPSQRATAGLALVGVQTIPSEPGSLYGGGQVGIVSGPSPDVAFGVGEPAGESRTWTAPVFGGTLGCGPIYWGEATHLQIELTANLPAWGDEGDPPIPATGVSIGVFGLLD